MNVRELISMLLIFDMEMPVCVMNDNGCRDPGYDEATHVQARLHWEKNRQAVFIDSDF